MRRSRPAACASAPARSPAGCSAPPPPAAPSSRRNRCRSSRSSGGAPISPPTGCAAASCAATSGPGRLRAPAGGETTLTAPVAGVLRPSPWPYPGQAVAAGEPVFRLQPQVSESRSLAELASAVSGLEADLVAARARRQRLQGLLELEAVSRRETEEAAAREAGLAARLEATRRDLAAARAARSGAGAAEVLTVTAPSPARWAASPPPRVPPSPPAPPSPGWSRPRPLWLEVALAPGAAVELAERGAAGVVLATGEGSPWRLPAGQVRLVSIAPEADADTGKVVALLELTAADEGRAGTVPLPQAPPRQPRRGGGPVARRAAGDRRPRLRPGRRRRRHHGLPAALRRAASCARRSACWRGRESRVLVERLCPGQRLVTRGGDDLRRIVADGQRRGPRPCPLKASAKTSRIRPSRG